jgi:hypothetical protein
MIYLTNCSQNARPQKRDGGLRVCVHHFHKQSVIRVQLYLFLVPLEQKLGWVQTYTNVKMTFLSEENYNY